MSVKIILLNFLIYFSTSINYGQNEINGNDFDGFHYGFSGKLNIELSKKPNFKLSLTAGLGFNIEDQFFPTIHTGLIVFNRGPIGSNLKDKRPIINSHFFYSLEGTVKFDTRDYDYYERRVPLYHFSDFTANPLQNPYKTSFSYGAIWIRMLKDNQRIGFFNFTGFGKFQFTYYNDGGPILKWVSDKLDRYYTGGVLLSYHGNTNDEIDLIELGYHKFTGYQKHAFDIAHKLQIDFLTYKDINQISYNQQRWKLHVSSTNNGFGANVSLYDYNRLDLQDFLHFTKDLPYHPDYNKGWKLRFGGRYDYTNLNVN